MINLIKKLFLLLVFCLISFSCEQYAVFDDISGEIKPKDALIQGSLSKIAGQGGTIYVANGSLWRFSGGAWSKDGSISGVHSVAQNGNLIFVPETAAVYKGSFGSWSPVEPVWPGRIAGIFDGPVYLSVDNGKYYVTGAVNTQDVIVNDKSGALMATTGGLYNGGSPAVTGYNVLGVLSGSKFGNIAVTSGGHLIVGTAVHSLNRAFTGALAEDERGVLAGLSRGYCVIRKEGSGYSVSVPDESTYSSTIGRVRVTSMAVAGNVIFACVVSSNIKRSGLMSFRNNQWNME